MPLRLGFVVSEQLDEGGARHAQERGRLRARQLSTELEQGISSPISAARANVCAVLAVRCAKTIRPSSNSTVRRGPRDGSGDVHVGAPCMNCRSTRAESWRHGDEACGPWQVIDAMNATAPRVGDLRRARGSDARVRRSRVARGCPRRVTDVDPRRARDTDGHPPSPYTHTNPDPPRRILRRSARGRLRRRRERQRR